MFWESVDVSSLEEGRGGRAVDDGTIVPCIRLESNVLHRLLDRIPDQGSSAPEHILVRVQIVAIVGLTESILPRKSVPLETSAKSTTSIFVAVLRDAKSGAFISINAGLAHLVRRLRLLFEFTPSCWMKKTQSCLHHRRIL